MFWSFQIGHLHSYYWFRLEQTGHIMILTAETPTLILSRKTFFFPSHQCPSSGVPFYILNLTPRYSISTNRLVIAILIGSFICLIAILKTNKNFFSFQVGEMFKVSTCFRSVTVDGYVDPSGKISFGHFSSMSFNKVFFEWNLKEVLCQVGIDSAWERWVMCTEPMRAKGQDFTLAKGFYSTWYEVLSTQMISTREKQGILSGWISDWFKFLSVLKLIIQILCLGRRRRRLDSVSFRPFRICTKLLSG